MDWNFSLMRFFSHCEFCGNFILCITVAKITFVVAEIILKWWCSLLRWPRSLLENGSRECKSNNKHLYHIKLTWARSPACIHYENVGNCSNGGIKYKLSVLLYISHKFSRNKILWIYVKALHSDFQRCWYIFLIWVFRFFVDIYTFFNGGHFLKQMTAILYCVIFHII